METDIKIERSKSNPEMWYWAFIVDGSVHSDGEHESRNQAEDNARIARWEWEDRNR